MSKVWFDAYVAGASSLFSAAGSLASGLAARDAGSQQSNLYGQMITQTQVEEGRAHIDLTNQANRTLATGRAVSAAQGGDIDTGIISGVAGEFGEQQQRITDDSQARQRMLKARSDYAQSQGQQGLLAGALKGLGQAGQGAYSFYKSFDKTTPTSNGLSPQQIQNINANANGANNT